MTVKEFVAKEKVKRSTNYSKYIATDYLNYEEKIALCKKIINKSCYIEIDGEQIFKANTPLRCMLYCLSVIDKYTNIDIDFNNALEDYNLLEKYELSNELIEAIPQEEIGKLETILKMILDDIFENERSMISFLDGKFRTIELSIDTLSSNLDQNKLKAFINNKILK